MSYTKEDAQREVGDSKDWLIGFDASIKKWEQRAKGNIAYGGAESCGLCFVSRNRKVNCETCPLCFCIGLIHRDAQIVLQYLKDEKEKYEATLS